jgi:hypothetical protein
MHSSTQVGIQTIEFPDCRAKNSFSTVTSIAKGGKVVGNPTGLSTTTARMQSKVIFLTHISVNSGWQRMQPPFISVTGTDNSRSNTPAAVPTSIIPLKGFVNSKKTHTVYLTTNKIQSPTRRGGTPPGGTGISTPTICRPVTIQLIGQASAGIGAPVLNSNRKWMSWKHFLPVAHTFSRITGVQTVAAVASSTALKGGLFSTTEQSGVTCGLICAAWKFFIMHMIPPLLLTLILMRVYPIV